MNNDPPKDHESENSISRRAFLAYSGKLIGIGILSHFAMVGKVFADEPSISTRGLFDGDDTKDGKECGYQEQNSCKTNGYKCTTKHKHSCASSTFICTYKFTCEPASANNCKDLTYNQCKPKDKFKPDPPTPDP